VGTTRQREANAQTVANAVGNERRSVRSVPGASAASQASAPGGNGENPLWPLPPASAGGVKPLAAIFDALRVALDRDVVTDEH
jgi:hypothetical protein